MRLFIAINFDEATKDRITAVQDRLRKTAKGNFSRRENFHLTLAFLGETDAEQVATICRIMETLTVPKMKLDFDRVGRFRRERGDIRWIGIKKQPELIALQKELTDKLRRFGFPIEERGFSPHITLSRETVPLSPVNDREIMGESFSAQADSISLMLSERINGKLTYTEQYRVTAE